MRAFLYYISLSGIFAQFPKEEYPRICSNSFSTFLDRYDRREYKAMQAFVTEGKILEYLTNEQYSDFSLIDGYKIIHALVSQQITTFQKLSEFNHEEYDQLMQDPEKRKRNFVYRYRIQFG